MRIGELARRSGLTIDTIRFYEKCGLLDAAHVQRSANGYRVYDQRAVERCAMIKVAQSAGFTLAEIGELLGLWERAELSDALIVARLREKQARIAATIAELQQVERYLAEKIAAYGAPALASTSSANAGASSANAGASSANAGAGPPPELVEGGRPSAQRDIELTKERRDANNRGVARR